MRIRKSPGMRCPSNGCRRFRGFHICLSIILSVYFCAAVIAALIFSTRSVLSMPCTIAASSSVSIWDAGHPRQCIPISIRIGADSGKILRSYPIFVSLEICAISISSLNQLNFFSGFYYNPCHLNYQQYFLCLCSKLFLNFLTCFFPVFRFFEYLKVKNETDFFRQFYIFITTHQNVRSFLAPE